MPVMKFYLVQAVMRSSWGSSKSTPRIVSAKDPIDAARAMFDAIRRNLGRKVAEKFMIYPQRDPAAFMEDVGPLKIGEDFDEDTPTPYDAVCDMFEARAIEVRL